MKEETHISLRRIVTFIAVVAPYVLVTILFAKSVNEPRRIKHSVEQFVSGTCDAWADIALIYGPQRDGKVIPYPKTTGPTLFKIQADFRKAYITHGCLDSSGRLPPADHRVAALLPGGLK